MSDTVIDRALDLLNARYIFPDKAAAASAEIRAAQADGGYDGLDEAALGVRLTAVLQAHTGDKHLRVRVRQDDVRAALTEDQIIAAWHEELRLTNYGIARVERLDGNVGYVDLRSIADPAVGGPAIAAAMSLVADTHALIFDLRRNGGGSPHGVIFWNSYLFPDAETHLNSIYARESGTTREFWSLAYVPGRRYLDRPVYVLTSCDTFSGGEEFAYNLQQQKRATLIGETTRGGAHPTQPFPLTPTLEITVPIARSVNPVTGTNWEGTGVEPDIAVTATEALDQAYTLALRDVLASSAPPAVLTQARAALARR